MFKWLHHLFNPHCESCFLERQRELEFEYKRESCKTCEVLEMTNAELRGENQRLLDIILLREDDKISKIKEEPQQNFSPIRTMPSLWKNRRAALEHEDRMRADEVRAAEQALADKAIELKRATNVADLEKSLDVVIPETTNA